MKINKLLFLFSALTFVACNEEFLEEFPTSYITPEQIAEASQINPDLQAATVAGIYESMYKYGTGSANDGFGRNDRDFGHRGYVFLVTCFWRYGTFSQKLWLVFKNVWINSYSWLFHNK